MGNFRTVTRKKRSLMPSTTTTKNQIKVVLAFSPFSEYFTGVVSCETFLRKCRPFTKAQHALGQEEGEEQKKTVIRNTFSLFIKIPNLPSLRQEHIVLFSGEGTGNSNLLPIPQRLTLLTMCVGLSGRGLGTAARPKWGSCS